MASFLVTWLLWFTALTHAPLQGPMAPGVLSPTSWIIVQEKSNPSCSLAAACSTSMSPNIVAGDGVLAMIITGSSVTVSSVSETGGSSTYTHCPSCHINNASVGNMDASYTVSDGGSVSAVTTTASGTPSAYYSTDIIEFRPLFELTLAYDTSNNYNNTTNCTACTGVALTLTGSRPIVLQGFLEANGPPTSVNLPYLIGAYNETAWNLAAQVGTAIVVNQSPTGNSDGFAIGFK